MAPVLKTGVGVSPPWVRIPLRPPIVTSARRLQRHKPQKTAIFPMQVVLACAPLCAHIRHSLVGQDVGWGIGRMAPFTSGPAVWPVSEPLAKDAPAVPTKKPDATREWTAWLDEHGPDNPPNRKQAEAWAAKNNYSTEQVRGFHSALGIARGRPKKSGK